MAALQRDAEAFDGASSPRSRCFFYSERYSAKTSARPFIAEATKAHRSASPTATRSSETLSRPLKGSRSDAQLVTNDNPNLRHSTVMTVTLIYTYDGWAGNCGR